MVEAKPEPVEKWTDCNGINLLDKMYRDPTTAFDFQMYQMLTLKERNAETSEKPIRIEERSLVSARHIFCSQLFMEGKISVAQHNIMEKWFDHLIGTPGQGNSPASRGHVDHLVIFRIEPEVALERIRRRSRIGESPITLDYLRDLNCRYDDIEDWYRRYWPDIRLTIVHVHNRDTDVGSKASNLREWLIRELGANAI